MNKENILGYLFSTSSRLYKKSISQKLEKYDLTITQCGVIRILWFGGELTQAEIADNYSSDRATIGSVIMKLQEKNYVEKKLSSTDRRAYVVTLTPKARKIAKEINMLSDEVQEKALEGMSQEEVQQLYKSLNIIIKNLS